MIANYYISVCAIPPYFLLLVTYIIILCRRKISDYFLRLCAWLLMAAINLRISMSTITSLVYYLTIETDSSETDMRLTMLKLQVFEFTVPYYCFLMITVTLIVSAISFYLNLRNLLYPELEAQDLAY